MDWQIIIEFLIYCVTPQTQEGVCMAGPFAVPLMVAGTVMSAAGMVMQGRAQKKQAEAQADVVRNNSLQNLYDSKTNESIAEANKRTALMQADEQKNRILELVRREKASAMVKFGKSADFGGVSFDDIFAEETSRAEAKAADALYEGSIKGKGFGRQALAFERSGKRAFSLGQAEAFNLELAGKNAQTSSMFSAAGTLMSGLGQAGYVHATM